MPKVETSTTNLRGASINQNFNVSIGTPALGISNRIQRNINTTNPNRKVRRVVKKLIHKRPIYHNEALQPDSSYSVNSFQNHLQNGETPFLQNEELEIQKGDSVGKPYRRRVVVTKKRKITPTPSTTVAEATKKYKRRRVVTKKRLITPATTRISSRFKSEMREKLELTSTVLKTEDFSSKPNKDQITDDEEDITLMEEEMMLTKDEDEIDEDYLSEETPSTKPSFETIFNTDFFILPSDILTPIVSTLTSVVHETKTIETTRLRTYTFIVTRVNGAEQIVTSTTEVKPQVKTLTVIDAHTLTTLITLTDTPLKTSIVSSEGSLHHQTDTQDNEGRRFNLEEARYNLATRIMSNGVEVIVAGDKSTYPGEPNLRRILSSSQSKPITLAPSTLTDHMMMLLPQDASEVAHLSSSLYQNQFVTKTCLTTYTYLTTYLENGSTTVSSHEQVVSNIATEERNAPKIVATATSSPGITLTQNPNLATGVFHTTYTYLYTIMDEEQPIVITSKHTVANTVTAPDDYLSLLQPSESATAVHDTNTYLSTVALTKTLTEGTEKKVISTKDVVTQVVITESVPPKATSVMTSYIAYDMEDLSPSTTRDYTTTDVVKTYFVTYTYYNTFLEDGKTVVKTNVSTSSDVVTEKLFLQPKKTQVNTQTKTVINASPIGSHNKSQFTVPIDIFATKTYLTTYTYFTTYLQDAAKNKQPVVSSNTRTVENVVTEHIASSAFNPNFLNNIGQSLERKSLKSIITSATLLNGEEMEITAVKKEIKPTKSMLISSTSSLSSDTLDPYSPSVITGSTIIFFDEDDQIDNLITPTLTSKPTNINKSSIKHELGSLLSSEIVHKDQSVDENSQNYVTSILGSKTAISTETTLNPGNLVIENSSLSDSNKKKIHKNQRPKPGILTNLGTLSNSLTALGPVINAMAGLIQTNLQNNRRSDNFTTTTTARFKATTPRPVEDDIQSRSPIYIPVAGFSDKGLEVSESQNIAAYDLNLPPQLRQENKWTNEEIKYKSQVVIGKPTHESPLVNGGIPISPGQVITANSDVIVGIPTIGGPRLPLFNKSKGPHHEETIPLGMKPPPLPKRGWTKNEQSPEKSTKQNGLRNNYGSMLNVPAIALQQFNDSYSNNGLFNKQNSYNNNNKQQLNEPNTYGQQFSSIENSQSTNHNVPTILLQQFSEQNSYSNQNNGYKEPYNINNDNTQVKTQGSNLANNHNGPVKHFSESTSYSISNAPQNSYNNDQQQNTQGSNQVNIRPADPVKHFGYHNSYENKQYSHQSNNAQQNSYIHGQHNKNQNTQGSNQVKIKPADPVRYFSDQNSYHNSHSNSNNGQHYAHNDNQKQATNQVNIHFRAENNNFDNSQWISHSSNVQSNKNKSPTIVFADLVKNQNLKPPVGDPISLPEVIERSTGQPLLVNIQPSQVANVIIPHGSTTALIFGGAAEPHKNGQYFDDPSPYPEPETSPGFIGIEGYNNGVPQFASVYNGFGDTSNQKPVSGVISVDSHVIKHDIDINVPPLSFGIPKDQQKLQYHPAPSSGVINLDSHIINHDISVHVPPISFGMINHGDDFNAHVINHGTHFNQPSPSYNVIKPDTNHVESSHKGNQPVSFNIQHKGPSKFNKHEFHFVGNGDLNINVSPQPLPGINTQEHIKSNGVVLDEVDSKLSQNFHPRPRPTIQHFNNQKPPTYLEKLSPPLTPELRPRPYTPKINPLQFMTPPSKPNTYQKPLSIPLNYDHPKSNSVPTNLHDLSVFKPDDYSGEDLEDSKEDINEEGEVIQESKTRPLRPGQIPYEVLKINVTTTTTKRPYANKVEEFNRPMVFKKFPPSSFHHISSNKPNSDYPRPFRPNHPDSFNKINNNYFPRNKTKVKEVPHSQQYIPANQYTSFNQNRPQVVITPKPYEPIRTTYGNKISSPHFSTSMPIQEIHKPSYATNKIPMIHLEQQYRPTSMPVNSRDEVPVTSKPKQHYENKQNVGSQTELPFNTIHTRKPAHDKPATHQTYSFSNKDIMTTEKNYNSISTLNTVSRITTTEKPLYVKNPNPIYTIPKPVVIHNLEVQNQENMNSFRIHPGNHNSENQGIGTHNTESSSSGINSSGNYGAESHSTRTHTAGIQSSGNSNPTNHNSETHRPQINNPGTYSVGTYRIGTYSSEKHSPGIYTPGAHDIHSTETHGTRIHSPGINNQGNQRPGNYSSGNNYPAVFTPSIHNSEVHTTGILGTEVHTHGKQRPGISVAGTKEKSDIFELTESTHPHNRGSIYLNSTEDKTDLNVQELENMMPPKLNASTNKIHTPNVDIMPPKVDRFSESSILKETKLNTPRPYMETPSEEMRPPPQVEYNTPSVHNEQVMGLSPPPLIQERSTHNPEISVEISTYRPIITSPKTTKQQPYTFETPTTTEKPGTTTRKLATSTKKVTTPYIYPKFTTQSPQPFVTTHKPIFRWTKPSKITPLSTSPKYHFFYEQTTPTRKEFTTITNKTPSLPTMEVIIGHPTLNSKEITTEKDEKGIEIKKNLKPTLSIKSTSSKVSTEENIYNNFHTKEDIQPSQTIPVVYNTPVHHAGNEIKIIDEPKPTTKLATVPTHIKESKIILPTKYITHTQTLTVTTTKTTVIKSLGAPPSTLTLLVTKTRTSTIVDTVTQIHTLVQPTSVVETVTQTVSHTPITENNKDIVSSYPAFPVQATAILQPEIIPTIISENDDDDLNEFIINDSDPTVPAYEQTSDRFIPQENESIFVVMTDKKQGGVVKVPKESSEEKVDDNETPHRDEILANKDVNHVLLGGILIASPPSLESPNIVPPGISSECRPDCKASRNELCQRVEGVMRCVCRPGFARMFPDRPCKPTYTYRLKITLARQGKDILSFKPELSDPTSPQYIRLASATHEGLDRMVMQSDLRDIYHGVQVNGFEPAQEEGVINNFYVQLSDNTDELRLKEVFKKYLRNSNYSLGGTDLFAARELVDDLEALDFDECTNMKFHDCSEHSQCFNLKGTYTCSCKEGFADLSENPLYPGRICSAELIGCERCHYHGTCYARGDEQVLCECFQWYAGEACHINLKVLLIALVTLGAILLTLLLICIILTCVKRRHPENAGLASGMGFLPHRGVITGRRAGTLDRRAMIQDTSSEGSDTLPYVSKKNKKLKGALKKSVLHDVEHEPSTLSFVEQRDRSLTVMIPRAKYHPAPPTSPLLNITSFEKRKSSVASSNEAKLLSYLDAGPSPSKDNARRKHSNTPSDSCAIKNSRKISTGALVSAGFEVSATVSGNNMGTLGTIVTTCGTEADRSENATLIQKISADLLSSTGSQSQFTTLRNVIRNDDEDDPIDNWLDITPRVMTVSEARSFDETTIQPPTKSLRSGGYDSSKPSSQHHHNDEANTMAERDLGSTFLLPHTHLYKPDRGSDISGFDSL